MTIIKIQIDCESEDWRDITQELLSRFPRVKKIDINEAHKKVRLVFDGEILIEELRREFMKHGIRISVYETAPCGEMQCSSQEFKVFIDGMTCRSCELKIERAWKIIDGVIKVNVNAPKGEARVVYDPLCVPSIDVLQAAVAKDGYYIRHSDMHVSRLSISTSAENAHHKLTSGQLAGLFAFVIAFLWILSQAGFLKSGFTIGKNTGFWAVFFIGLVAASSSCIAVSGGLLLSSAARFHERYGAAGLNRMYPVYMFVMGRVIAYGVFGALIGLLGKSLSLPPIVMGIIALIAALYMLVMGLEMLNIAPRWMHIFLPRIASKRFSHKVLDSGNKSTHPLAPFMLGSATFFLPCGFTQALQLYALTTGSIAVSALLLFGFALGTAPALLALGWASSSLKGKVGLWFFRFAGALVVILGLYNIQNSMVILGYPLPLPSFNSNARAARSQAAPQDPNVAFDGTRQIVKMTVDGYGYTPSEFTVTANTPVRWEIDASGGGGCLSVLQAQDFGIRKFIGSNRDNIIEFTPRKPGRFLFSCSMGMYKGYINVVPKT